MNEIETQIADQPEDAPTEGAPYRNLWVPLVIVPAGIVIAIVVVFALFGSLAGDERSLSENLDTAVHGGKNQREQALFGLMRQVSENQRAFARGEALPWAVEPGFADRVVAAVEQTDDDEYDTKLALGSLLAGLDSDPRGVDLLVSMLGLEEGQDPGAKVRFKVVQNLGLVGDVRAARAIVPLLESDDEGLRVVSAMALGNLPSEGARGALLGALGDSSLAVRGTAAMGLSKFDPPVLEAGPVLRDLTGAQVYEAVRAQDRTKYTRAHDISRFRIKALEALARLGRDEDWSHIGGLQDDPDPNVVDAVMTLLKNRGEE